MKLVNIHENTKLLLQEIGYRRGFLPITEKEFDFVTKRRIDIVWINRETGRMEYAFEVEMPSSHWCEDNRTKLEALSNQGVKVLQLGILPEGPIPIYTNIGNEELNGFLRDFIADFRRDLIKPIGCTTKNANLDDERVLLEWNVNGEIIKIERWLKSLLEFYYYGVTGIVGSEIETEHQLSFPETIPYLLEKGFIDARYIDGNAGVLMAMITDDAILKFGNKCYTILYQISKKGKDAVHSKFDTAKIETFKNQVDEDLADMVLGIKKWKK